MHQQPLSPSSGSRQTGPCPGPAPSRGALGGALGAALGAARNPASHLCAGPRGSHLGETGSLGQCRLEPGHRGARRQRTSFQKGTGSQRPEDSRGWLSAGKGQHVAHSGAGESLEDLGAGQWPASWSAREKVEATELVKKVQPCSEWDTPETSPWPGGVREVGPAHLGPPAGRGPSADGSPRLFVTCSLPS